VRSAARFYAEGSPILRAGGRFARAAVGASPDAPEHDLIVVIEPEDPQVGAPDQGRGVEVLILRAAPPDGLRQATPCPFALSRRSVGGAGPQRFTKTDLAIPGGIPVL
jgi:hypothetical protein